MPLETHYTPQQAKCSLPIGKYHTSTSHNPQTSQTLPAHQRALCTKRAHYTPTASSA